MIKWHKSNYEFCIISLVLEVLQTPRLPLTEVSSWAPEQPRVASGLGDFKCLRALVLSEHQARITDTSWIWKILVFGRLCCVAKKLWNGHLKYGWPKTAILFAVLFSILFIVLFICNIFFDFLQNPSPPWRLLSNPLPAPLSTTSS